MTEYKHRFIGKKHKSLYIGLTYNIIIGVLIALAIFFVITIPAKYIIARKYSTTEKKIDRAESYAESLQDFITSRKIKMSNLDDVNDWIRREPYVFLLIYDAGYQLLPSSYNSNASTPGIRNKIHELVGSRISEDIDRNTLINMAQSNGYYDIELVDGTITVAIAEFTENLYMTSVRVMSYLLAFSAFFAVLINYMHMTIERIKRFESDVTIVSEIDINYEIISEGADEIANLSANVEVMRQRMLENIKSETKARETNTELISAISHDIRTPLTVLLGYLEMMKERETSDPVMQGYISASENTAYRLKHLSDNMFKYSLAFGDTDKGITLEEYDASTLLEQLISEDIVLLREEGYNIEMTSLDNIPLDGYKIITDAPNLMRIVDNVFSNLKKYADKEYPIRFTRSVYAQSLILECKNKITKESKEVESNGIGLKNCVRLGSTVADKFEYENYGDFFICRLVVPLVPKNDKNK